jgi:quercetin dioxygenase-like cupin family protein
MNDDKSKLAAFVRENVQRFSELSPLKVGPPDRVLPEYERDRFSVVGRPDERPDGDRGVALNPGFNIGYIRCAPGKGHCSHSHPDVEIFIPMSGRWEIKIEDLGSFIAEPWDVVVIPGDVFHSATNVSDAAAYIMSVNAGTMTAGYTIAPAVLEKIKAARR